MQTTTLNCEACSTEDEEFLCTVCGHTGTELAEIRWNTAFWSIVGPSEASETA